MRHHLLRGAAAVAIMAGTSAYAADLPVYEPVAPAPVVTSVAPSWTGFYVGAIAGYNWYEPEFGFTDLGIDPDDGDFPGVVFDTESAEFDLSHFLVGGTLGFDVQFNRFVIGAMGDVYWSESEDGQDLDFAYDLDGVGDGFAPTETAFPITAETDWGANVLARLGFLATDRVLVYGLAGWSWKNVDYAYTDPTFGDPEVLEDTDPTFGDDETVDGWTVGAGVEALVTDMVSVKGEYRYTDFDEFEIDASGSSIDPAIGEVSGEQHQFLVGVNFRFGGLFN